MAQEVEKNAWTEHEIPHDRYLPSRLSVGIYRNFIENTLKAAARERKIFNDHQNYWSYDQFVENVDLEDLETTTFVHKQNILNEWGKTNISPKDASCIASMYIEFLITYALLTK